MLERNDQTLFHSFFFFFSKSRRFVTFQGRAEKKAYCLPTVLIQMKHHLVAFISFIFYGSSLSQPCLPEPRPNQVWKSTQRTLSFFFTDCLSVCLSLSLSLSFFLSAFCFSPRGYFCFVGLLFIHISLQRLKCIWPISILKFELVGFLLFVRHDIYYKWNSQS